MFFIFLVFCVVFDGERVSYLLSFQCCGRKECVFLIFLVFCVVVGWGRVSYLLSFLCCGRMGACFLSS